MPLTSAEVTAGTRDSAVEKLWREWLALYFNNAPHLVGSETLTFPSVALGFGQSTMPQPLDGAGITLVTSITKHREFLGPLPDGAGNEAKQIYDLAQFRFIVRAQGQAANGKNAQYQAREVMELLRALLMDPALIGDLAQKGIANLQVGADGPVPDNLYQTRSLTVRGEIHYKI